MHVLVLCNLLVHLFPVSYTDVIALVPPPVPPPRVQMYRNSIYLLTPTPKETDHHNSFKKIRGEGGDPWGYCLKAH